MKSLAPDTGATVTVAGPEMVTGLMNSGGDVPGSMIVAVSTVCGGGVGVGVGVGLGVAVGVGVGGVGVGVAVGVSVGVGVAVGVGVGAPAFTITTPRGLLLPSCVKLWIRRKCLSGTTIVRVGLVSVITALWKGLAIRSEATMQRQLIQNAAEGLLIFYCCFWDVSECS